MLDQLYFGHFSLFTFSSVKYGFQICNIQEFGPHIYQPHVKPITGTMDLVQCYTTEETSPTQKATETIYVVDMIQLRIVTTIYFKHTDNKFKDTACSTVRDIS